MNNLIDKTYFFGEINIPNVNEASWIESRLTQYISEYQKKILVDLLGIDLYLAFETGLSAGSPAQKWLDLRDGKTYTVDYNGEDYSVKWNGLINSDKISLLAYFIYFYMVRDGHITLSGTSTNVNKSENSIGVTPSQKIINAWNKGLDLYGNPYCYRNLPHGFNILVGDVQFFPNYVNGETLQANAFNFINAMNIDDDTTYPKWIFSKYKSTNSFGI